MSPNKMKQCTVCVIFLCTIFLVFVLTIRAQRTNDEIHKGLNASKHQKWVCSDNKCEKSSNETGNILETCKMLCGSTPPLWPKPRELSIMNKNYTQFQLEHIFLKIHSPSEIKENLEQLVNEAFFSTLQSLSGENYHLYTDEVMILKLSLHINYDTQLSSETDENYTLYTQNLNEELLVNLFANNYFGARHGLETLSQLIWYDDVAKRFNLLHDCKVQDSPSFHHRGVLIDVSRHYFPIDLLKKAVSGMAASKLNVLHLHIGDVESFPLILPNNNSRVSLQGAYDYSEVYTVEEIQHLIEFAKRRGIRTIIEVDAPSHVSPAAFPADEILCNDPDIFRTTLNPDNPESLNTLQSIYDSLFQLGTDRETFHIGDDEVITDCWKETTAARNADFNIFGVWADFTNQMLRRVQAANNNTMPKNVVLWSSPLTDRYIQSLENQTNLVVQFWFGHYQHILDKGYKIIFSTVGQWYLDCGFGPWKKHQQSGSCDPYTDWRKFYKYRPWKEYSKRLNQVLGGEVCLWSEEVSPDDLETRLWPRAAAFAERVWNDPNVFDQDDVFRRIDFHSARLRRRGFRVAAIWPEICSQYPDRC